MNEPIRFLHPNFIVCFASAKAFDQTIKRLPLQPSEPKRPGRRANAVPGQIEDPPKGNSTMRFIQHARSPRHRKTLSKSFSSLPASRRPRVDWQLGFSRLSNQATRTSEQLKGVVVTGAVQ